MNSKLIFTSCITFFLMACGQLSNSKRITEAEINESLNNARKAAIYAQVNQTNQTRLLFKAAYNDVNHQSKTYDEILFLAGNQVYVLNETYRTIGVDLNDDIKKFSTEKNSLITIGAIDGLCVGNKFIIKYLKVAEQNSTSPSKKELAENALKLQPLLEEALKNNQSPLDDIVCLSMK